MGNLEIFIRVSGRTAACVMVLVAVVAATILVVSVRRHFDEHGTYIGRRAPAGQPDDVAALSDEIDQDAEAILPCGGGMQDADQAADILRARYGRREMLRRCVVVAFDPANAGRTCAIQTACAVLYARGDTRLLQQIIAMRAGWYARAVPAALDRPARLDTLIAGLCQRLSEPLPPGVQKLTEHSMAELRGN